MAFLSMGSWFQEGLHYGGIKMQGDGRVNVQSNPLVITFAGKIGPENCSHTIPAPKYSKEAA